MREDFAEFIRAEPRRMGFSDPPAAAPPSARRYTPTAGMLRALTDARGADALDYERCVRRGLLGVRLMPTAAGRAAIRQEILRREGFARA